MAFDKRIGFGQVEPQQLSAQKTGQIYASLPLDPTVEILENGEFMYYDYKTGTVTAEGTGEPMLVFNEIKIYEDWLSYKDFAMIRVGDNYVTNVGAVGRITSKNTDGTTYGDGALTVGIPVSPEHTEYGYRMDGIAPRLFKTNVGDIYTTNMIASDEADVLAGHFLAPQVVTKKASKGGTYKTLVLTDVGTSLPNTGMAWVVCANKGTDVYTMPDGQPAVKIQRVQ